MALHQYLCPECGVALQSARDVTGKAVRCLGCQAVFTARPAPTISKVPPPPRKPDPAAALGGKRPSRRDDGGSDRPELPPISRGRQVPAALLVVGGAATVAVGLTVFLAVRYRDKPSEGTPPAVAQNEPPAKPIVTRPPAASRSPVVVPAGRVEDEEPTGAVPEKDVNQKSIQYYFEGLNSAGHAVVANGSRDSPNIALVMESEFCGCDAF